MDSLGGQLAAQSNFNSTLKTTLDAANGFEGLRRQGLQPSTGSTRSSCVKEGLSRESTSRAKVSVKDLRLAVKPKLRLRLFSTLLRG